MRLGSANSRLKTSRQPHYGHPATLVCDLQSAQAVLMTTRSSRGVQPLLGPALVCWVVGALPLSAQTVINPRILVFAPSSDHNATFVRGTREGQSLRPAVLLPGSHPAVSDEQPGEASPRRRRPDSSGSRTHPHGVAAERWNHVRSARECRRARGHRERAPRRTRSPSLLNSLSRR